MPDNPSPTAPKKCYSIIGGKSPFCKLQSRETGIRSTTTSSTSSRAASFCLADGKNQYAM